MSNDNDNTLKLEQCIEVGVFAWHDDGIVFAYGKMFRLDIEVSITSHMQESPRVRQDIRITGARVFKHDTLDSWYGGWHHLPDCTCKYCLRSA